MQLYSKKSLPEIVFFIKIDKFSWSNSLQVLFGFMQICYKSLWKRVLNGYLSLILKIVKIKIYIEMYSAMLRLNIDIDWSPVINILCTFNYITWQKDIILMFLKREVTHVGFSVETGLDCTNKSNVAPTNKSPIGHLGPSNTINFAIIVGVMLCCC